MRCGAFPIIAVRSHHAPRNWGFRPVSAPGLSRRRGSLLVLGVAVAIDFQDHLHGHAEVLADFVRGHAGLEQQRFARVPEDVRRLHAEVFTLVLVPDALGPVDLAPVESGEPSSPAEGAFDPAEGDAPLVHDVRDRHRLPLPVPQVQGRSRAAATSGALPA